jgi:hypothetical protein
MADQTTSTGYTLINSQLINMIQYIKNVQPSVAAQATEYKNLVNAAELLDPSLVYNQIIIHLTDELAEQINNRDEAKLIVFLQSFAEVPDIGDAIQFILSTWTDLLTMEQKTDVWRFIQLIVKITRKLQHHLNGSM